MAVKFCVRLVAMFKSSSYKFGFFSIACSRFIKGHRHRFFGLCRCLNNSRTKRAMAVKFWLRLLRMFKSISWKFGAFSNVCSHFIKGHPHRLFGFCRRLNNPRTKLAMALKFWLRLVRMFKSISLKFGAFSIVDSHFIKGHPHRFFGFCRRLNSPRTKQAMALKFWVRFVQMFKSISWKFGVF